VPHLDQRPPGFGFTCARVGINTASVDAFDVVLPDSVLWCSDMILRVRVGGLGYLKQRLRSVLWATTRDRVLDCASSVVYQYHGCL